MHLRPRTGKVALTLIFLLSGVMALIMGCSGICNKRLYIFRETPEKSPIGSLSLVITDPNLAAALMPEASARIKPGTPWAPEQPHHTSDAYRLSLIKVDGRIVYQGTCMDTLIVDVCEVRAGSRRLSLKAELYGPWGRRNLTEELTADLDAGMVYFLGIEWAGGPDEVKVKLTKERLGTYNPQFRQRLLDWQRRHTKGRSLD